MMSNQSYYVFAAIISGLIGTNCGATAQSYTVYTQLLCALCFCGVLHMCALYLYLGIFLSKLIFYIIFYEFLEATDYYVIVIYVMFK